MDLALALSNYSEIIAITEKNIGCVASKFRTKVNDIIFLEESNIKKIEIGRAHV